MLAGEFLFWRWRISSLSSFCLAGGAGTLCTLAFSPFDLFPILFVSFTILLLLLPSANGIVQALVLGWSFGVGYFFGGLYWIVHAFLVVDLGLPLGWLAVFLLSALLGLSVAAVAGLAKLTGLEGVRLSLAFACLWTLGELVRGFGILGGFPWNLIGYTWAFSNEVIQITSLIGVFGLSTLTVFLVALPAGLIEAGSSKKKCYAWAGIITIGLGLVWVFGFYRLDGAPTDMVKDVKLRLVQANVSQQHKWNSDLLNQHLLAHVELSGVSGNIPVTHVVWPETAVPYPISNTSTILTSLSTAIPKQGLLLTGAVRTAVDENGSRKIWNGLTVVNERGNIVGSYDKRRLVPFGEYIPLRKWLSFNKLVSGSQDFLPGNGPQILTLGNLPPFRPLICYEAIFPGVLIGDGERPAWLLNLTNDAWYGKTPGPYQHFTQTRFRSIEEGIPLVRAASTGISAVIDPYGRIVASLALGEKGVLDIGLPAAKAEGTLYGRSGNPPLLIVVILLLGVLVASRKRTISEG